MLFANKNVKPGVKPAGRLPRRKIPFLTPAPSSSKSRFLKLLSPPLFSQISGRHGAVPASSLVPSLKRQLPPRAER
jgi:hypothetical protein